MSGNASRRRFLQGAAMSGVAYWVAGRPLWAASRSANEKLNIGFVGAGGRGEGSLGELAGENVVALCDVDFERAANAIKKYPQARRYHDFRKMLDEQKDIDAVVVSTPDHTHAVAAVAAMRRGKHVYCEKPLTHSVYEARLLRETAASYKVATQMGNQGTSHDGLRRAVELVQAGVIGPVREAHVWTNRPIWPQGIDRPQDTPPVPASVRWDLWLGPAKERPYHSAYHPFAWRGWWDFGTGALGDMACHTANMAFMALRLGAPISVEAKVSAIHPETAPKWSTITYQFPSRGEMPPVKLVWYDGKLPTKDGKETPNLPPAEIIRDLRLSESGSLLIGDKGILFSPNDYGSGFQLIFQGTTMQDVKVPEPSLPRSPGHHREWVLACKGGPPAMSNFDYAGRLTETVLLGNIACRVGHRIEWDEASLRITNCPEANDYVRREYRSGWEI